jgi:hypothetical protein
MKININLFIIALLVLIFIGIVNSKIYEPIIIREPPHFLRRLGLAPRYCPYRDQYY